MMNHNEMNLTHHLPNDIDINELPNDTLYYQEPDDVSCTHHELHYQESHDLNAYEAPYNSIENSHSSYQDSTVHDTYYQKTHNDYMITHQAYYESQETGYNYAHQDSSYHAQGNGYPEQDTAPRFGSAGRCSACGGRGVVWSCGVSRACYSCGGSGIG